MLTGRETMTSIEAALNDLRREEAELGTRIERATRAFADFQTRKGEAYKDLARFRLDTQSVENLDIRLDSAAREARRLLEKRASDLKVLMETLRTRETERAELQAKRDSLIADQTAAEDRLDGLMDAVDETLEKDAAFLAQRDRTLAAQKTAEAAAAKAKTAVEDRASKGKAYDDDRLFIYLWQRGFGTPDYNHRGLTRALDRWVAGIIDFHGARANYAMLTSLPEKLEAHAERCAEIAEEEAARLTALSRAAMEEKAGEDLVGKIETLSEGASDLETRLAAVDKGIETVAAAVQSYSTGDDDDYQKAEEHLAKSLEGDDLDDLWRAALATPSPEDEKIVRQIEDLSERMESLTREIRQDRELQRDITARRSELTDVVKRFRTKGYDQWESTFSDNSLTTVLLGELLKGGIDAAEYWARAERSHKRRKPRGGQVGFPGGSGLPSSMGGRRSGGGSFGGGGFKSGGGFGGGGFTTGGSF
ncbi:hypothetical protein [Roseibium sediminis]|uniref:hypothetical protein n=1 Tax=Roseibium sediminis TaxID=1775174 RepID=UPI00123D0D9D|nr:hypothetical protein [Roseibium sediminis]